jgi:predicted RecA/RadA family phage recombinase
MTSILKVQNIQYTDGDSAITIADGGGVTAASTLTSTGAFTSPGIDDNGDAVSLTIDSSENVTINSGNLVIGTSGKGIDFAAAAAGTGGTGAAETSTATVLDDYEEGTFTPSSNSVTGTNGGNGALVGFYVKVGNLVCCAVRFQADGMSTNGHQFGIYLPFLAHSTTGSGSYNAFETVPVFYAANSNGQHRIGTLDGNSNYINMRQQNASNTSEITGNSMGGSFNMNLSIVYRTKD